jgi:putative heme-binding domain-containing protein
LATVLSQSRHVPSLLDAVERGDVQPWSIEPTRRNQLLQSKDPTIKERAQLLFKGQGAGDRMKVYEEYKSVLTLAPNSKNGHEVFKRVCANCHTHTGEGSAVGPDLTGVRNQPAEALLLHILVPSYEIVAGFTSYDIELKDGRSLSGLIASETESSVTLRRALAEQETVLRSNIVSINSGSLSLMPDELEKGMTKQELADLVAFLKGQ